MLGLSPLSAATLSALSEVTVSTDRYASASNSIGLSQSGAPADVYKSLSNSILIVQAALIPYVDLFATSGITLSNVEIGANSNALSAIIVSQSAVPTDAFQTIEQTVLIASRCDVRTGFLASGRYRR